MFVSRNAVSLRHTGRDLVLAKFFRHLRRDFDVARLGIIESRFLTARIKQLFDIFHTLDVSGAGHGNLRLTADGLNDIQRLLMGGISLGHVVNNQFVCVVIAVKFRQSHRVRVDDGAVRKPFDGISFI